MARISAKARCWCAVAVVSNSKVGASGPALGVRQVLRTMVDSSAIRVAKLCTGSPSSSNFDVALALAEAERSAGASFRERTPVEDFELEGITTHITRPSGSL